MDEAKNLMLSDGIVRIEPVMNAVTVQLVGGKPVVGIMLKDEAAQEDDLTKLARKILAALEP